jgi:hypothetical protein
MGKVLGIKNHAEIDFSEEDLVSKTVLIHRIFVSHA